MTDSAVEGLGGQIQAARRFAALSGRFNPQDALSVVLGLARDDTEMVVALAAGLAAACDTHAGGDAGRWLMRGPERRWELEALSGESLGNAIGWRRAAGDVPNDTGDLLDALAGVTPFDTSTLREMIAAGGPRDRLERAAVALDRAGRQAPAGGLLGAVRATLTRVDNRRRGDLLLARGFVGRDDELASIADWLRSPVMRPPVPALFVSGLPGIGKSTLLEAAVRSGLNRPWIVVRLDFDRAGLDVQDWVGLTIELARQVAAEVGEQAQGLLDARLTAAAAASVSTVASVKGQARERVPVGLARSLAHHVERAGRPVLLILDTLEVLRGRGETHPRRLFTWLDQLVDMGVGPISVIAAGRGDALDSASSRVGSPVPLTGLDAAGVDLMITRLGVSPANAAAVREVAEGNPLVMQLAASVAEQAGAQQLRRVVKRKELAAAYLYRFLLFRIDEPTLKDLAYPGLVVRRISAEVIADVLGPQLGHPKMNHRQAVTLFEALSRQHWLVEPDALAPGFVRHRPDVRQMLLRLLYESSPAKCARIDRAAAAWFGRRTEPWCEVEAAYHRLQLMRRDPATPPVNTAVLRQFDDQTIAELPEQARNLVRRERGERSSLARDDHLGVAAVDVEQATREFEALVGRGDWVEAGHFYDQILREAVFEARSSTADLVRAFLWRSGSWRSARKLLDERDRLRGDDHDLASLPHVLAAPRAEMRAEFTFDRLLRSLATDTVLRSAIDTVAGQSAGAELNDGALGFALQRAGMPRLISSAEGSDTLGAVVATWGPDVALDTAARAFNVAEERLSRRIGEVAPTPDLATGAAGPLSARLLAVLLPYGEVVVSLSRLRDGSAVSDYAGAVYRRLTLHGGLPPEGAGPWTLLPAYAEAIDCLADCGLLAEWLGAAAFVLRDADLTLIARSAERWRRTAAGQWSYGSAPASWQGWQRQLDVTMVDRLDRLLAAADPVGESHRQLALWSIAGMVDDNDTPLLQQIRRRLAGSLDTARAAMATDGETSAAQALLRRYVPSAFVPALTVLIQKRQL